MGPCASDESSLSIGRVRLNNCRYHKNKSMVSIVSVVLNYFNCYFLYVTQDSTWLSLGLHTGTRVLIGTEIRFKKN